VEWIAGGQDRRGDQGSNPAGISIGRRPRSLNRAFEAPISPRVREPLTFDLSAQYGLSYDMTLDGTIISGRSTDRRIVLA
jgi:hypothetical protein